MQSRRERSVEEIYFILCLNRHPESEVSLSTNIVQTELKYFEVYFGGFFFKLMLTIQIAIIATGNALDNYLIVLI